MSVSFTTHTEQEVRVKSIHYEDGFDSRLGRILYDEKIKKNILEICLGLATTVELDANDLHRLSYELEKLDKERNGK